MRGSPDELERIQERTRQGHYKLDGGEARWRDKAELLLQHGYRLRPRLIPGWTPSWEGTDLLPQYCEDSVRALSVTAMDAIRVLDGKRVMIKKTRPQTTKATVVHILEIFPDTSTVESNVVFIVMPLLREFYDPPFDTVREGVDFMRQTLTGITFMHKSGVAHLYVFRILFSKTPLRKASRECTAHNIMMDASQMYPNCFHPTRKSRNFDGISTAKCISRTKAKSVKYFFTDFEKSRVITSEGDRRMRRRQGARNLPPEIERGELYDPFPVDMYYLGNTNREHLLEVCNLQPIPLVCCCLTVGSRNTRIWSFFAL